MACLAFAGCGEQPKPATPPYGAAQSPPSAQRSRFSGCAPPGYFFRHGRRNRRVVALSFDDAPSAFTLALAHVLKSYRAKATFFVLANQIGNRAGALRRLARDGHELGNHSYSHPDMTLAGVNAIADIRRANRSIGAATGFTPCLFRAPYGKLDPALVRRVRAAGMTTIGWDVDPSDWNSPGVGTIAGRVLGGVRPGSIVVLHDSAETRGQTLAALPRILRGLKQRHYRTVTVSRLLGGRMLRAR